MNYQQILYDVKDKILTITLNRPEKLNAYTIVMQTELYDAIERANADDDIRAIIVTATGRGFCGGFDISGGTDSFNSSARLGVEVGGPDTDWSDVRLRDGSGRLALLMYGCLKPIIGAVNGVAVGVGATLLLPMDIRIASEKARFGFIFARRGMVPEFCANWFLPKLVGVSQALKWCFTGRIFDAHEAQRGGLVDEVVPEDQLLPTALALAAEIRDNCAPVSIALIRQAMWRIGAAEDPMEAHKLESRIVPLRGRSPDVKEGVLSFIEKRLPDFPNKISTDMPHFPWWKEREFE